MKNHKFSSKFNKFALGALIAASITSSAVAVNLDGFFVGAQGGYSFAKGELNTFNQANQNSDYANQSISDKDDALNLGLKVGYDFDLFRVYGAYNHNFESNFKSQTNFTPASTYVFYTHGYAYVTPSTNVVINNEIKQQSNDFIIGADYTPKFTLGKASFKGILGAFAGYSKLNIKANINSKVVFASDEFIGSGEYKFDTNAILFGLRLGAIYEIIKSHEIEFGFKFDTANYKDKNSNATETFYNNSAVEATYNVITPFNDIKRTNMGVFVGYNYKF